MLRYGQGLTNNRLYDLKVIRRVFDRTKSHANNAALSNKMYRSVSEG